MDIYLNFKNKGVIKLPVVPKDVFVEHPQKVETFEAIGVGDLNIVGEMGNRVLNISTFFPVKEYPFLKDRTYKGMEYVNRINLWRENKNNPTLTISRLNVRMAVCIKDFSYGVQDGSGDIYYNLTLEEVKPSKVKKVTPSEKIKTTSETVDYLKNTYGVVVGNVLIVRSGPGLGYKDIGELKKGDKVKVLKVIGDWWQIMHDKKVAYVYGKNQQLKKV